MGWAARELALRDERDFVKTSAKQAKKTAARNLARLVALTLVDRNLKLSADVRNLILEIERRKHVTEAVRQVLALAVSDDKSHTTRAVAVVCERALAALE
jgi:hypothetical protein